MTTLFDFDSDSDAVSFFEADAVPTVFASGLSRPSNSRPFILAGAPIGVVALELSPMLRSELATYTSRGGRVFVDSGAFPAFKRGTTVDFDAVLDVYDFLAEESSNPSNLELVAPDIVGDQAATLELLRSHLPRLRALVEAGITLLVPMQLGTLEGEELYSATEEAVDWIDFVPCLPFNEKAWTNDQAERLLRSAPIERVHLLGGGIEKTVKLFEVAKMLGTEVQGDANRRRSLVGRGRLVDRIARETLDLAPLDVPLQKVTADQVGDSPANFSADWIALLRDVVEEAFFDVVLAETGRHASQYLPGLIATPNQAGEYFQPGGAKWDRVDGFSNSEVPTKKEPEMNNENETAANEETPATCLECGRPLDRLDAGDVCRCSNCSECYSISSGFESPELDRLRVLTVLNRETRAVLAAAKESAELPRSEPFSPVAAAKIVELESKIVGLVETAARTHRLRYIEQGKFHTLRSNHALTDSALAAVLEKEKESTRVVSALNEEAIRLRQENDGLRVECSNAARKISQEVARRDLLQQQSGALRDSRAAAISDLKDAQAYIEGFERGDDMSAFLDPGAQAIQSDGSPS